MTNNSSSLEKSPPPPPEVPRDDTKVVSFPSADVPVQAVTVFRNNKAEVTRVIDFSSPSCLGRHEVELEDLPGRALIEEASVRVKGSGHCTILHVSYSDGPKNMAKEDLTQEKKDAIKAKREEINQEIQRLTDELTVLHQQSARNKNMRDLVNRFAERAVVTATSGSANVAAVVGASDNGPAPSVSDVGEALDWWAARAAATDAETHRLELEERRLNNARNDLLKAQCSPATQSMLLGYQLKESPGRISVTIDVQELGPIDLEVKYMTRGATWSPSYDLRVDTQADSISCTYYGMVTQNTKEDWEGVALRLSTAEPTVHGTPPVLGVKVVSLKVAPTPAAQQRMVMGRARSRGRRGFSGGGRGGGYEVNLGEASFAGDAEDDSVPVPDAMAAMAAAAMGCSVSPPGAPPAPPRAIPAVARVEGGSGSMGAVSFVVEKPAVIKSNGQTKKLTVGILELSADVAHYVVPAKEPAAYLQAKATNDTEYLLLASGDVSVFFDNSFVTKTSISSVSPGESFQTFLGIDPAVKIMVAAPRKTNKKRGIFSKSNHVTHTHRTSISNKKRVPVTCVIVDAIPRSTDEIIKVNLTQPTPASVSEAETITDSVLMSTALEQFCGDSSGEANVEHRSPRETPAGTRVLGVVKSPSNHLAWVATISPQGELSIPLEYTVEWPTGKEIEVSG